MNEHMKQSTGSIRVGAETGSKSAIRNTIAAVTAAIASMVANPALANEPAFWSVQGDGQLSGDSIQIERGKDVGIYISVNDKGTFTAPDGWITKWNADKCSTARPQKCGTWEAHSAATKNENPTFSYKSGDEDAKAEDKVFVINVKATGDEKFYPKSKGDDVEARLKDVEDNTKASVTAGIYGTFVPNLPTTTQPGVGVELNVGANVTKGGIEGAYIGGALGFSHTEIPIESALRPVITSGSENRYQLMARAGWYPQFGKHFSMLLGGEAGLEVFDYSTTFTRQEPSGKTVEFVRENNQKAFAIGPVVAAEINITPNFGIAGQFSLPVTVNKVSRTIGEGVDAGGLAIKNADIGASQADPTLSAGMTFRF